MSWNLGGLVRRDFIVLQAHLARYEQCPASAVYAPAIKEEVSFPQWHGIFVHRFLERCVSRGHDEALAWIRTKKMRQTVALCEAIDPDALLYGMPEVGWAHDPEHDLSRRVPHSLMDTIDRRTEQFGRADLVVELGVERPVIADYKCGQILIAPTESTQLLGLAASYRSETRVSDLDVALVHVASTGALTWHLQTVDDQVLTAYVRRSRGIHARILEDRDRADAGIVPEFVPGDECKWCSLRKVCPAK